MLIVEFGLSLNYYPVSDNSSTKACDVDEILYQE
jgi:hypothetical protein